MQLQNNSRTTRGKKSTQFLKGTTRDLFQRILETKSVRTWKIASPTFFKFMSLWKILRPVVNRSGPKQVFFVFYCPKTWTMPPSFNENSILAPSCWLRFSSIHCSHCSRNRLSHRHISYMWWIIHFQDQSSAVQISRLRIKDSNCCHWFSFCFSLLEKDRFAFKVP